MRHRLLSPLLFLALGILSRRGGARRHLPGFEGQAIALRLAGDPVPYVIAVRGGRFIPGSAGEEQAEICGDLRTFVALLLGRLDYDAAFFRKRLSFRGSLPTAMRFKALFDQMTL